jgi:hypothetical protein
VSIVSTTTVVVAVVISAAAGMNRGMTGMAVTSLGGSNCQEGDKDKAQYFCGLHANYYSSSGCPLTLVSL